jgi:hypothetical protein
MRMLSPRGIWFLHLSPYFLASAACAFAEFHPFDGCADDANAFYPDVSVPEVSF